MVCIYARIYVCWHLCMYYTRKIDRMCRYNWDNKVKNITLYLNASFSDGLSTI